MISQKLSIAPLYSSLCSKDLLNKVVPLYKIRNPHTCDFLWEGINDSYKIASDEGEFLLRIYRKGWRNTAEINFEIDVLNFLKAGDAKVAFPVKRKDGSYITCVNAPEGERFAIMTKFAGGKKDEGITDENISLFAEGVASIHSITDKFTSIHERFLLNLEYLLNEPLERIRPFLAHRKEDWNFLLEYSTKLSKTVSNTTSELLDYGFCHGDFHGGNAHKIDDGFIFFDFDCCGFGLRVYDLAIFKWSARRQGKEEKRWKLYIEAYRQFRHISDEDLKLVDTFVSIRQIWMMGLHIEISLSHGWLDDSYFDQEIQFLRDAAKNQKL